MDEVCILVNVENKAQPLTQCIHHAGFRADLQVHRSLARAVTVDNEVATNSRTLHTLNVMYHKRKFF
jgi:hypothetical protein